MFRRAHFDGVLHFAAHSIVPDSMDQPGLYFANNVAGVVTLVNTMLEHGVRRLVFSSSAAVYGEPDLVPIPEDAPVRPDSPYGESKAIVERMLAWYAASAGLQYAALRYFNAAGASERLGEDHQPETHLIPLALQSALGQREGLTVFGTDYCTPDGTAVRDYVHVLDLAEAHARAIERLDEGNLLCNLGNEVGYSVRQVLDTVQAATGRGLTITQGPRRPGDAPITVADTARARAALGGNPDTGCARWWRALGAGGWPIPTATRQRELRDVMHDGEVQPVLRLLMALGLVLGVIGFGLLFVFSWWLLAPLLVGVPLLILFGRWVAKGS